MQRKEKKMWDPISIFFCMWVMSIGLPEGRLKIVETIETREQALINKIIVESTTIRTVYEIKNY